MEHFKELVIRLQTLNFEITPVDSPASIDSSDSFSLSISSKNPRENIELAFEFEVLKQKALLDIAILQGEQVFALLKKLYVIQIKYEIFWERYHENIKEHNFVDWGKYYKSLILDQLFLVIDPIKGSNYQLDLRFFIDLRESLSWKEEILFDVIEEMEILITKDEDPELEETAKPEKKYPINSVPLFAIASQYDIINVLGDFFVPEDRPALQELIVNRVNPTEKLLFKGSGNQLADAFKQLIEANLITGFSKRQLERWITEHFQYQYQENVRSFTARYLNGIISSESRICQSPILDVRKKDDNLTVVPLLRTKKQKNR